MKLASVRAHDPETIRVLGLERYPSAVRRPVRRLGGACDLGELLDPQTALLDRIDLSSAPEVHLERYPTVGARCRCACWGESRNHPTTRRHNGDDQDDLRLHGSSSVTTLR